MNGRGSQLTSQEFYFMLTFHNRIFTFLTAHSHAVGEKKHPNDVNIGHAVNQFSIYKWVTTVR
jgi:hypothetical protein